MSNQKKKSEKSDTVLALIALPYQVRQGELMNRFATMLNYAIHRFQSKAEQKEGIVLPKAVLVKRLGVGEVDNGVCLDKPPLW